MKKAFHLLIAILTGELLFLSIGCKKRTKKIRIMTPMTCSFSNTAYTGLANMGNHYFPISKKW
jgi:hypothetical protein